jgi:hypothetical protein
MALNTLKDLKRVYITYFNIGKTPIEDVKGRHKVIKIKLCPEPNQIEAVCENDFRPSPKLVDEEQLRQSAIKWVKAIRNKDKFHDGKFLSTCVKNDVPAFQCSESDVMVASWIIYFFNITESELK